MTHELISHGYWVFSPNEQQAMSPNLVAPIQHQQTHSAIESALSSQFQQGLDQMEDIVCYVTTVVVKMY
jgi:hypothetical protein